MTSELIVLNAWNCFGYTFLEYFNVYSEISASEDVSPKIKSI